MAFEYLVSFDTDRIKDYVFATDKLREVRGASKLLTHLNDPDEMERVIRTVCQDFEIVYFAGGSGAVLVPSACQADNVIRAVEQAYRRATWSGSITGVRVPLAPATGTLGFGRRVASAAVELRARKDEKACRTLATIEPYTLPCTACERYPAIIISKKDRRPVCGSCENKREAFRGETAGDLQAPADLGEIGDLAHPRGYIGFIYADGNNLGDQLKKMEKVGEYRDFALGLDRLVKCAVTESVASCSRQLDASAAHPWETLLLGGDDLMLVTAGELALPVALKIAEYFERESKVLLERVGLPTHPPLTLGLGVVLAHDSFPIAAFLSLAEQLIKQAKQLCASKNYQTSAIDFMVVTAAASSQVKRARAEDLSEQAFVFPHQHLNARLTQRPYLWPEAAELLDFARDFRQANFPTSQLHFLREGLFHSLTEAVFRWRQVAGRASLTHRGLMKRFQDRFSDNALPPWKRVAASDAGSAPEGASDGTPDGGREYVTALGDLAEIYPFC